MNAKMISVIIVSYRSEAVIDNCIRSILQNNDIGERLEIILIEQSPEDNAYRELTERYPEVRVFWAENRGFGAGNNAGAARAEGEILFFLNPDTVIEEPLFTFVGQKFAENPRLGLMGVKLLSAEGENISYNMRIPYGLIPKVRYVLSRKADRFDPGRMYIEGADLILRREAFRQAGGFDENIFMYGEEPDLCLRIGQAGYEIRYFGEKTIRHLQGKCTEDRYPAVYGKQLDSFLYVCEKHGIDGRKWLKREARYQGMMARIAGAAGNRGRAELAKEMKRIAEEKTAKAGEEA